MWDNRMRSISDEDNSGADVHGQGPLVTKLPYLDTVHQAAHLLALELDIENTSYQPNYTLNEGREVVETYL